MDRYCKYTKLVPWIRHGFCRVFEHFRLFEAPLFVSHSSGLAFSLHPTPRQFWRIGYAIANATVFGWGNTSHGSYGAFFSLAYDAVFHIHEAFESCLPVVLTQCEFLDSAMIWQCMIIIPGMKFKLTMYSTVDILKTFWKQLQGHKKNGHTFSHNWHLFPSFHQIHHFSKIRHDLWTCEGRDTLPVAFLENCSSSMSL